MKRRRLLFIEFDLEMKTPRLNREHGNALKTPSFIELKDNTD